MFSKRPLPNLQQVSPSKRLRCNLADLFLANEVSGLRATSLIRDARQAGAAHFTDLKNIGAAQGSRKKIIAGICFASWGEGAHGLNCIGLL